MDLLAAVVLGIVQGLTEFLPVSSSGHLTIAGAAFEHLGWDTNALDLEGPGGMRLNIALHLGTLFSILVVFRKEVATAATTPKWWPPIVLATLPIVAVGLLWKDKIEERFADPLTAGICLLGTAVLLLLGHWLDRARKRETAQEDDDSRVPSAGQAAGVGLFQAMAVLPGISRSGSTIAGGLMLGMSRPSAARFSFLIAIPAICGATVLLLKDILSADFAGGAAIAPMLIGAFVSFMVGWVALRWLLHIVARGRLPWFAAYCLIVGVATILWQSL